MDQDEAARVGGGGGRPPGFRIGPTPARKQQLVRTSTVEMLVTVRILLCRLFVCVTNVAGGEVHEPIRKIPNKCTS
jgi:hypothetical protein